MTEISDGKIVKADQDYIYVQVSDSQPFRIARDQIIDVLGMRTYDPNKRFTCASLPERLTEKDTAVLIKIVESGPLSSRAREKWFAGENKKVEMKLKAFQLIKPIKRKKDWDLDITDYGLDVLNEWRKQLTETNRSRAENKQALVTNE